MTIIRSVTRPVIRSVIRSALADRFGGLPPLPDWVTTGNLWAEATQGNTDPQDMTALWTRTNVTATANVVAGPYAGSFGDLITESTDGANATHEVFRSSVMDFDGASDYLHRVVAKRINRNINCTFPATQFGGTAPQVTFDLQTGVASIVTGSATATMTDLGDGWWLCTMQATSTASGTNVSHRAFRLHNGTAVPYTGDGSQAVYIAAVGLEQIAPVVAASYLLMEDGSYLLLEDGSKILME